MFIGRPLFPGENEHDQLIRIMAVIGIPPRHILEKSKRRTVFFNNDFSPKLIQNKRGVIVYPASKELFDINDKEEVNFKDFITKCLDWDINKRLSAESALKHPWIKGNGLKEMRNNPRNNVHIN